MSWTPERIAEMTRLWTEGLSTSQIGKRIGVTKNAVVGKVHRLGLPGRESPIRRRAPELVALKGPPCKWPIGVPGEEDFHYCGRGALPSKPYCPEHDARAYIRVAKRTADAA